MGGCRRRPARRARPSRGSPSRPSRFRRRSEPFGAGDVRLAPRGEQIGERAGPAAAALPCRRSSPGRASPRSPRAAWRARAPASVAALRAAVCESDWTVGARMTSASSIAAATLAGGSAPCDSRSAITASTASRPDGLGAVAQALADACSGGIADDEHVLALLDDEAILDHRLHGPLEITHRAEPRRCLPAPDPSLRSDPRRSSSAG